jgi:hypothetical protein
MPRGTSCPDFTPELLEEIRNGHHHMPERMCELLRRVIGGAVRKPPEWPMAARKPPKRDVPEPFEPPLPSLLPPGKRVLLNGKPVANAIHGNVEEGVVPCFDYDGKGRIVRDEYGVPILIEMRGGVVTTADVESGD